jgi:hypothetical protein
MAKGVYHFTAISKMTLEFEKGSTKSTLKHADLRLETSENTDKSVYFDGRGLPRKAAMLPTTSALIQGLIVNVRLAQEKGWWKEAEHMQYILSELGRAFVNATDTLTEGTM